MIFIPHKIGVHPRRRAWPELAGRLELARREARWQVHVAGMLDALPDSTARALKDAVEATRDCASGAHVTLAIGYGGAAGDL
jgi:undecaprenyl pyrophosphate synthase